MPQLTKSSRKRRNDNFANELSEVILQQKLIKNDVKTIKEQLMGISRQLQLLCDANRLDVVSSENPVTFDIVCANTMEELNTLLESLPVSS